MNYVTYDDAGKLSGGYCQELQPDHEAAYIEVSPDQRENWTNYQANPDRDGLEPAPLAQPAAAIVPQSATRRQARQALLLRGKLALVQPAIDAIEDDTLRGMAQIEWDDSLEFLRDRPLVVQIGGAIGLDAAGLDELFIFASSL